MAYLFNGTNQALASEFTLAPPFTFSAIAQTSQNINSYFGAIVSLGDSTKSSGHYARLSFDGGVIAPDSLNAGYSGASSQYENSTASQYSLNTWHSAVGIYSGNPVTTQAYLDTAPATLGVKQNTVSFNADRLGIGVLARSSLSQYLAGNAAEVAIWNAVLTGAEIASLAKGFPPRRIRPQSLVFYAPLIRNLQDVRKGLALTPVNGPTVAPHPRVYA